MSYKALYRRFRPNDFDSVVGQDNIVQTLKNQVISNHINHAYLFCGTRGTGKTSVAKIFARAMNCPSNVNGSPCGQCAVCKALSDASSLDIIEIDAASNNRVDEIRDLREKVKYPPVDAKYKVYIIDEVHMLTESAFNALLKTLEEPPSYCVFILATTEPHKLPKTILSRCMRFDFRLIDNRTLEKLICKIFDECSISYDLDAIKQIAKAGNGSARDTISIADTCSSYVSGKLTLNDVLDILGENTFEQISNLAQHILDKNAGNALIELHNIYNEGKNLSVLAQELTEHFRNLIALSAGEHLLNVLEIPSEYGEKLLVQSKMVDYRQKVYALSIFAEIETNLKYSINPLLNIEVAILKIIDYLQASNPISPPSVALNTNLDVKSLKKVWGKYLMKLQQQNNMVLYSACEDVVNVYQKNDEIVIEVSSQPAFQLLSTNENKQDIIKHFTCENINNNIKITKIDENKIKPKSIAETLLEIVGEKLIIKE